MRNAYPWILVAAGGLIGCVAIGSMFALPVLLQPMAQATGWSRTGISSAMTFGFLAMGFASFGWGAVVDRYGPRLVVACGVVLISGGLALAARASTLTEFQIGYGLVLGIGGGAVIAPLMATVAGWFDAHRALAVSLVSAGMGMAPMTMSPLAAWLVSWLDWRTTLTVIAAFAFAAMAPAVALIRRPPLTAHRPGTPAESLGSVAGRALSSTPFVVLALANFCCCATHSGPIFHTVSYAISCGLPPLTAVTIYSVEGAAGMGGRLAFGLLGDRFGAKRVVVAGLFVQALAAGAYIYARDLAEFYSVATVFGFAYAGVMPLYAVLARENFPAAVMGTVFGGLALAGSLGMAFGPVAGGWIFDTAGTYRWLYLASLVVGVAAALIAATFPSSDSSSAKTAAPEYASP
jgi:MFS family permease